MSDARTLLRAKRQEARIQHPFAAYTSSGQLRCTACSTPVKSSAMWEGHLGSKPHRLAVARLREAEAAKAQAQAEQEERERKGKRKAEDEGDMDVDMEDGSGVHKDSSRMESAKKRRTSEEPSVGDAQHAPSTKTTKTSGFPVDFFSDPSQAPVLSTLDSDSEDEPTENPPVPNAPPPTSSTNSNTQNANKTQLDLEWEAFQASLNTTEDREEDQRAAYDRATVFAEPELAPSAVNGTSGFPPGATPDVVAANGVPSGPGEEDSVGLEEKEETEEEKRARKEREERELIMDRLIEEERLQEEADERVGLLKARVEALKKAREAKRAAKLVRS